MKAAATLCLVLAALATLPAPAQASTGAAASSNCGVYRHYNVAAIVGVATAGDIEFYGEIQGCGVARSNTQTLRFSAAYEGPVLTSPVGGTLSQTWNFAGNGGPRGCTVGSMLQSSNPIVTGLPSWGNMVATVTMTSAQCDFAVDFQVAVLNAASVVVFNWETEYGVNIRVEQPNQMYLCGPTGLTDDAFTPTASACGNQQLAQCNADNAGGTTCTDPLLTTLAYGCRATQDVPDSFNPATSSCSTPQVNNLDYLCAATGTAPNSFGNPVCSMPTINAVVSGTLGVAQSGTWQIDNQMRLCAASALGASCTVPTINLGGTVSVAQSGTWQIDNQNRLCASSAFGTACTTPTVNGGTVTVTPGGVQHLVVDAWPTLNAALSGTVHVAVDSLPTVNVAGSLTTTIASWPGLSVGVTSFPTLNIGSVPTITVNDQVHVLDSVTLHHVLDSGQLTLSGVVHPCSTALLAADRHACDLNTNSTTTTTLTVGNQTVTFPMSLMVAVCGANFVNGTCAHPVLTAQSSGAVQQLPQAWWALIVATALLGIALVADKKNWGFVGFAGLWFLAAAAVTPFNAVMTAPQALACRAFVALFGLVVVLYSAFEVWDAKTGGSEARATRREQAEAEA